MFRRNVISLILCATVFAQTQTITVYTDKISNKVAQFERDIITQVFQLYDKSNKSTTNVDFIEMNAFGEAFDYMDNNVKTDKKDKSFAINKISFTNERAAKYDFSMPYMLNYYSVMALNDRENLHSIAKFDNKYTYGVVVGTIFHDKVKELNTSMGLKFKTYPSVKEMNDALQSLQVDFIITDYVDSWEFGLKSIFFYEETVDRLCILLPKGSALKKDLDKYLKYYLKSQNFFKLVRDYFGADAVRFFKQAKT